jgi:hypothetical protein
VEVNMSLHPEPIGEIPGETARVARAAFPKGTLVTRLRDEFSIIYQDEDFGRLYPSQGQPARGGWPWSRFSSSSRISATGRQPTRCAPASTGSTPLGSS